MELPARRDQLEQLNHRMRAVLVEAARKLWEIGQICLTVDADRLHDLGDFADVYAWAHAEHSISRPTVAKAMEVATHFNAEMAARWGTEKLVSTVRYLRATKRIEAAGDATSLRFRVWRDGKYKAIPFVDAGYRDIDDARKLVLRSAAKPPTPSDDETARRIREVGAALPPAPPGFGRVERVRVQKASDGRSVFSFHAIPEDDLPALIAGLVALVASRAPAE